MKYALCYVFGFIGGALVVGIYARGIIQRIRKDWQTANVIRGRREL